MLKRARRSLFALRSTPAILLANACEYQVSRIGAFGKLPCTVSAPAERRIAAAVALSATLRDEARQRVRIAVEACADDDLRRALSSAAEGEIDEPALARQERRASA